jgi:hypothetical protein
LKRTTETCRGERNGDHRFWVNEKIRMDGIRNRVRITWKFSMRAVEGSANGDRPSDQPAAAVEELQLFSVRPKLT